MPDAPANLEELKDLLEENIEIGKETNKLIKAMRRDALVGGIVKFAIWLVLIVASFYLSAKFLEPYLGTLTNENGAGDYKALFDQYRVMMGQ